MARRVVFLTWRDVGHPDGGGSEVFVEHVARWLAAHGDDVTVVCAGYPGAARDELRDGVTYRRRGGRFGVYPRALGFLLTRAGRRADVVVDVQNGLPFGSALVRRRPIVVLVHHCHREQWHILFPGPLGRIGDWVETRLAPRLYRGRPYVTVSESTRADLIAQGVDAGDIRIVRNGVTMPADAAGAQEGRPPTLCVLSRLVPHKQVEDALAVLAELRHDLPGARLDVIGDGWWAPQLHACAERLGVTDAVTFHGFVNDAERDRLLARSWLLLMPSIREGWGIAIMEAAALGVPAIGYRTAGGVAESIVDQVTGYLVDDAAEMAKTSAYLLGDADRRASMGAAARERARGYSWAATGAAMGACLDEVARPRQPSAGSGAVGAGELPDEVQRLP